MIVNPSSRCHQYDGREQSDGLPTHDFDRTRRTSDDDDADTTTAWRRDRMRAALPGLVEHASVPRIADAERCNQGRNGCSQWQCDQHRDDEHRAVAEVHCYSPATPWMGLTEPQVLQLGHCQCCDFAPKPHLVQRYAAWPS